MPVLAVVRLRVSCRMFISAIIRCSTVMFKLLALRRLKTDSSLKALPMKPSRSSARKLRPALNTSRAASLQ